MYLAAKHNNSPTDYAKMEDFVTSNVFRFLKYANLTHPTQITPRPPLRTYVINLWL